MELTNNDRLIRHRAAVRDALSDQGFVFSKLELSEGCKYVTFIASDGKRATYGLMERPSWLGEYQIYRDHGFTGRLLAMLGLNRVSPQEVADDLRL